MAIPHFPSNASEQIIDGVQLEAGCLYALLAYGGEWGAWEWAFYLPKPVVTPIGREGTLFHVTLYTGNDPPKWVFEIDPAKDITASPEVVALIRLTRVSDLGEYEDIVGNDGLTSLFRDVKIPSTPESPMDFSSRTWFTEAVGTLHDCAVVHCDDMWLLEREIKRLGFAAMDRYMEGRGWTVFRTDKCT